jgi:hypothetical protein
MVLIRMPPAKKTVKFEHEFKDRTVTVYFVDNGEDTVKAVAALNTICNTIDPAACDHAQHTSVMNLSYFHTPVKTFSEIFHQHVNDLGLEERRPDDRTPSSTFVSKTGKASSCSYL